MKLGDLVRFHTPVEVLKSRSEVGLIVGIRTDNLSITGRGVLYEILTPGGGVVSVTSNVLEPVQDSSEHDMMEA